jgi:uncharacterized protein (DUF302 family)
MYSNPDIKTVPSSGSVVETTSMLKKQLEDHGITIYGHIDQQSEAIKSGLRLKPLQLIIFGNPKGGIPLMNANPLCGLDLPLKLLIWECEEKKVWVSYNQFEYLQKRFDLPNNLIQNLSKVESIILQALNHS